jgi:uncharacterized membrane protein YtjA (UPF0391 family)
MQEFASAVLKKTDELTTYSPRRTDNTSTRKPEGGETMLKWALIFAVIAVVAALLGFGGIAGAAAGIAKLLFFIFLAVVAILLIAGLVGARKVP